MSKANLPKKVCLASFLKCKSYLQTSVDLLLIKDYKNIKVKATKI